MPSNNAEGYGRNTEKSFRHFLDIFRGSLFEIETQLLIANELGFITNHLYSKKS
ncbi:four helix bundle protein [Flavobacterium kayseriense]|uniref:four helix bundle protein n=1 Tax=Flavobacterium kayseriense TaxID=2764714 RepID=UPI00293BCE11|nr:four helix bundle protein [Flavobacterium kayseriense]